MFAKTNKLQFARHIDFDGSSGRPFPAFVWRPEWSSSEEEEEKQVALFVCAYRKGGRPRWRQTDLVALNGRQCKCEGHSMRAEHFNLQFTLSIKTWLAGETFE